MKKSPIATVLFNLVRYITGPFAKHAINTKPDAECRIGATTSIDSKHGPALEGKADQRFPSIFHFFRCLCFFRVLSERLIASFCPSPSTREVDPGIADLVSAMNKNGVIRTVASCEGHPKTQHPPYVYFSSSSDTAARIENALRKWGRGPDKKLSVNWQLAGQFDDRCQLKFCLHAPEYHERAKSFGGAVLQFWLNRSQVQQDLVVLTELMKQSVLDNGEYNIDDKRRRRGKKKPKQ